jgi:hypothetical protein
VGGDGERSEEEGERKHVMKHTDEKERRCKHNRKMSIQQRQEGNCQGTGN